MLDISQNLNIWIFMGCGCILGLPIMWRQRHKIGLEPAWQIFLLGILSSFCGFIGIRLFSALEFIMTGTNAAIRLYGMFFIEAPLLLLISYPLGLNRRGFFDALALASIPSLFLGRCSCIVNGCCLGQVIPNTPFRWPTRESELIVFIALFIILWHLEKKNTLPGQLFPILMMGYGSFRFVNEWFRQGDKIIAGFHLPHIWSVICMIVGFSIYCELQAQAEKRHGSAKRRRT